jgi:hypothetical protein
MQPPQTPRPEIGNRFHSQPKDTSMTRIRIFHGLPLLLLLGGALLTGCANTPPIPQEWDGLVLRPDTRLGAVFVKPDAEISSYTSVMLDPVQIRFAANWDPNQGRRSQAGRLNPADIAAIKERLAELFRETFRAELARGGYALVDQAGPETLQVTPVIVDLFVTAPGDMTPGRSRVYTAESGRMTLVAELRDSVTGELLVRVVDSRTGRGTGQLTWTNRVTNAADAQVAISVWATALRRALDGVYGRAGAN